MVQDIINSYDKLKEYIDLNIKIPVIYTFFIIDILFIYFDFNISKYFTWLPSEIEKFVLAVGTLIYNNYFLIFVGITVIILIINILGTSFNFPQKNEVEFIDGTIESMNFMSAQRRLSNLIELLSTKVWILYTTFRLLVGKDLSFLMKFKPTEIKIDDFLYVLNVFILIFLIIRNLYKIKLPNDYNIIETAHLGTRYIILNQKTVDNADYMIVKDKYLKKKKYFLVSTDNNEQAFIYMAMKGHSFKKRPKYYDVINRSEDISEIDYHFKNLR